MKNEHEKRQARLDKLLEKASKKAAREPKREAAKRLRLEYEDESSKWAADLSRLSTLDRHRTRKEREKIFIDEVVRAYWRATGQKSYSSPDPTRIHRADAMLLLLQFVLDSFRDDYKGAKIPEFLRHIASACETARCYIDPHQLIACYWRLRERKPEMHFAGPLDPNPERRWNREELERLQAQLCTGRDRRIDEG